MNSFSVDNSCGSKISGSNCSRVTTVQTPQNSKVVAAHSVLLKQALPTRSTSGGIQGVSVGNGENCGVQGQRNKRRGQREIPFTGEFCGHPGFFLASRMAWQSPEIEKLIMTDDFLNEALV